MGKSVGVRGALEGNYPDAANQKRCLEWFHVLNVSKCFIFLSYVSGSSLGTRSGSTGGGCLGGSFGVRECYRG